MTDYTDLRDDIAAMDAAYTRHADSLLSHLLEQSRQIDKLWEAVQRLQDAAEVKRMAETYGGEQ